MSILNKAVLTTLKTDSKTFVTSTQNAIEKANSIAKVVEQFISPKLIKARKADGNPLADYKDEVADAWQNMPDEVKEAITDGVTEGVLEGDAYKDKVIRMYDNGVEYVDPEVAEVSCHKQGKDFNPDDIKSFSMAYVLRQNWQGLSYKANKDGTTKNPMGSHGESFKKLADADRDTCKNTIDKNISRIKARIANYLASTYGVKAEVIDPIEEVESKAVGFIKSANNLTEKLPSAKHQKTWSDAVAQCDDIMSKAIASMK